MTIVSDSNQNQALMIDYIIHHQKAVKESKDMFEEWMTV